MADAALRERRYATYQPVVLVGLYGFFKGGPCKLRPVLYDVRLFYRDDEADGGNISRS
jgi:hypothetical protein